MLLPLLLLPPEAELLWLEVLRALVMGRLPGRDGMAMDSDIVVSGGRYADGEMMA